MFGSLRRQYFEDQHGTVAGAREMRCVRCSMLTQAELKERSETMTAHTPGPWKWLCRRSGYLDSLWGGDNESRNVLAANEEVASESDRFSFIDISDADSRLIAAAPELLKELKHLVRYFDQLTAADVVGAKAAIAKAEAGN